MSKVHLYKSEILWTGNLGTGTSGYKDYASSYGISVVEKPIISGSSDPVI